MNSKIEEVIKMCLDSIELSEFDSYAKLLDARKIETEFRKTLKNKDRQGLTDVLDTWQEYHAERENEIICFTLDVLRSILKD